MRIRRLFALTAATSLAAASLVSSPVLAPVAHATTCWDLDLGASIGQPLAAGGGKVDVHDSTGKTHTLTAASLGYAGGESDGFGTAVYVADVNADVCQDVIIGAPGTSGGKGAVYVVFGSLSGLTKSTRYVGTFGAAAVGTSVGHVPRIKRIYAGAPLYNVGSATEAGGIVGLTLSKGALGSARMITENSSGITGVSEKGDRFGQVLSTSTSSMVAGTPFEDVGSVVDAGAVTRFEWTSSLTTKIYTQDSPGTYTAPEKGDHFGAAVLGGMVGVPGEDLGDKVDTGMVELFFTTNSRSNCPASEKRSYVHQDMPGIPDSNESYDYFGSSLAAFDAGDQRVLIGLFGVPGEDGDYVDEGAVVAIQLAPAWNDSPGCEDPAQVLDPKPTANGRFGAAIGTAGIEWYTSLVATPGDGRVNVTQFQGVDSPFWDATYTVSGDAVALSPGM